MGKRDSSDCINEARRGLADIGPNELGVRNDEEFRVLIRHYDTLRENIRITDEHIETIDYLRRWEKPSHIGYSQLRVKKDFSFCLGIAEANPNSSTGRDIEVQNLVLGNAENRISRLLSSNRNTLGKLKPIIIVPEEAVSGNLHLLNAVDFIQEGEFKQSFTEEKPRAQFKIASLSILGKVVEFEVWDDISYLKNQKKLNQVVAIFIKGSAFQFKDCKGTWGVDTIAKLFSRGKIISAGVLPPLQRCPAPSCYQELEH